MSFAVDEEGIYTAYGSTDPFPAQTVNSDGDAVRRAVPRDTPSRHESEPLPFRQDLLWTTLGLSFFAFLSAALIAFTYSERFQSFVVHNANALFTIPYVISFIVILACLAPWVPSSATSLNQMNAGVISSAADFLLILLVLIEWATCLALMLVTLVAVHEGLSYISVDGYIVPRPQQPLGGGFANNSSALPEAAAPDADVGGIPRNSAVILAIPLVTLYSLFNVLLHLYSCIESLIRRRRGLSDTD